MCTAGIQQQTELHSKQFLAYLGRIINGSFRISIEWRWGILLLGSLPPVGAAAYLAW